MKVRHYLLIVGVVLVVASLACGSSDNTGEKVDTKQTEPTATPGVEVYAVGDVIQVKDHTIVLNSAEVQGNTLRANFTVENKSAEELIVSSLLSFEAKADDGTKLEQSIMDCSPVLDGTIVSGDKTKGFICWSGLTTDKVRIYYRSDLLGKGSVVWEVTK